MKTKNDVVVRGDDAMSESRFNRLEHKVDNVNEKVDEVKIDVTELKGDMKLHMHEVEKHVTDDNKIIKHIEPMLPLISELKTIVDESKYERMKRKNFIKNLKTTSMVIGIVVGVGGLFIRFFGLM